MPSAVSVKLPVAGGRGSGSGVPSAVSVKLSVAGGLGSGSGVPSAVSVKLSVAGGLGSGSGVPSATTWLEFGTPPLRLTDEVAGTTMEPISNAKVEARKIFVKRIGNTSRCYPLRFRAKAIL